MAETFGFDAGIDLEGLTAEQAEARLLAARQASAMRARSFRGVARRKPTLFVKNDKQLLACRMLNAHAHGLIYGGSRSGKSMIACRNLIIRGLKAPSRHLIVRLRMNHVIDSIGLDTMPKTFALCFPGLRYELNKTRWIFEFESRSGGTSQIWLGGIDDKLRSEKVLGQEYSTLFLNEVSQIPWQSVLLLWTRLAENSGLSLRAYYDCNPPPKKSWPYWMFFDRRTPDGAPLDLDVAHMRINPVDNLANLPPDYMKILDALPNRQRQRFRDGLFLDDVEGALWTDAEIIRAKAFARGEIRKIVVAVDPSVSDKEGSDEVGIVVVGVDHKGVGGVLEDASGKMGTAEWAKVVIDCYQRWQANEIVAETNNGGDLVEDALHNVDRHAKVVQVHASKGKRSRAEPVAQLFEEGQPGAWFAGDFPDLEEEMTTHDFRDPTAPSPNRIDAMVWGFHRLVIRQGLGLYHFE